MRIGAAIVKTCQRFRRFRARPADIILAVGIAGLVWPIAGKQPANNTLGVFASSPIDQLDLGSDQIEAVVLPTESPTEFAWLFNIPPGKTPVFEAAAMNNMYVPVADVVDSGPCIVRIRLDTDSDSIWSKFQVGRNVGRWQRWACSELGAGLMQSSQWKNNFIRAGSQASSGRLQVPVDQCLTLVDVRTQRGDESWKIFRLRVRPKGVPLRIRP